MSDQTVWTVWPESVLAQVVRYTQDEYGVPLREHIAMLGIGDYADEGEPDVTIAVHAGNGEQADKIATWLTQQILAAYEVSERALDDGGTP